MMKRKGSVNLFLVFCVVFLPRDVFSAPSQQFPFGVIEGVDVQAITSGKTVYAYYGIPFAEPPVGPLRFRPPVPYAGRNPNNVISSNSFRASCMQEAPPVPTTTSEDCLHLNIFAPSASSQTERKVMVWIHGGGYILGDVRPYTPTDLVADYDVIVVTIHYRLGFFGFMSTGDEASPGNNGLRDQVLALQWVKDNIRAFGGDPDDVTLFGESAGAGSVSFLSLSPYSKGLFTKAIMQSGTVFSPWSIISPARARSNFYKMAGQLNCLPWWYLVGRSLSYHKEIIECLRYKPAEEINQVVVVEIGDVYRFDLTQFVYASPTVDGDFVPSSPEALLKDVNYLRQNGVLDRSYVVGTTNEEGLLLMSAQDRDTLTTEKNMQDLASYSAKQFFPLSTNTEVTNLIKFVYSYPREEDGRPPFQGFVDLQSDLFFIFPTFEFVSQLSSVSPQTDIFLYLFDFYPEFESADAPQTGTNHGTDLAFFFDQGDLASSYLAPDIRLNTPAAISVTDAYRGTLTQFAKTGNPSRAATGGSPASWPRFESKEKLYMAIAPQSRVGKEYFSQRMSLWKDFLPQVATNVFTGRRGARFWTG